MVIFLIFPKPKAQGNSLASKFFLLPFKCSYWVVNCPKRNSLLSSLFLHCHVDGKIDQSAPRREFDNSTRTLLSRPDLMLMYVKTLDRKEFAKVSTKKKSETPLRIGGCCRSSLPSGVFKPVPTMHDTKVNFGQRENAFWL